MGFKSKFGVSIFLLLACAGQSCNKKSAVVPVKPEEEIDFSACLTPVSDDDLEIVTWNVKDFPFQGDTTVSLISRIIDEQQPDIVAFQEIAAAEDFERLTNEIEGYQSQLMEKGFLDLGFLYKTSEVSIEEDIQEILTDDFFAFPRPPVMIKIKHTGGFSSTIVSIHLKCCDGDENFQRRKAASNQLKTYIDTYLPDDEVIVLGDFNDQIFGEPDSENPFLNFIEDNENYLFADMGLAMSDKDDWSYPSWPSHIDHILITNELFLHEKETVTLLFDSCYDSYFKQVSDHRPVMIKLSK
jgi:endonuclease/exonuclease/phosphatase family metal-dependent hydrolase